uniref:Uncharacterized protein n=1 Tax=Chromera velia CCMP2878 TaxID=1169474 RepID=A0A0G4HH91_9ALVE|mmetsp:Transcript_33099/g.65687  ORF Transcript_33099/g.65687 Transcript_33099/m.65687 type:complete len:200 (-) Transcript_33099:486-1085(-)|eukprot:Cvel_27580.t1-p1 / transcript=Cvel_27580.t1 / gene=Cvel_27580 / organism=Chromera_velia_CCMP2878 / gene_product=hypothetical protein / transcript_product=hypothetical protein / location=Cvel_scaffold3469:5709-6305(+) / protein_length=199 / sequence_SO=supercontig / SO=protein_coding / is_pseudo=false
MVADGLELLAFLDTEEPHVNRDYQVLVPAVMMVMAELREVDRLRGASVEELAPREEAIKGVAQRALDTFSRWRTSWTPPVGGEYDADNVIIQVDRSNKVTACIEMRVGPRDNCLGNGCSLPFECESRQCPRQACRIARQSSCECIRTARRELPQQLRDNFPTYLAAFRQDERNDGRMFGEDFDAFLATLRRVADGNFNL